MFTELLSAKRCSVVFKIIEHGTHAWFVLGGGEDKRSPLNKRPVLCEKPRLLFKREKRQPSANEVTDRFLSGLASATKMPT